MPSICFESSYYYYSQVFPSTLRWTSGLNMLNLFLPAHHGGSALLVQPPDTAKNFFLLRKTGSAHRYPHTVLMLFWVPSLFCQFTSPTCITTSLQPQTPPAEILLPTHHFHDAVWVIILRCHSGFALNCLASSYGDPLNYRAKKRFLIREYKPSTLAHVYGNFKS